MTQEKVVPNGLTFDSVRIRPAFSEIRSRNSEEINTSTRVARGAPNINIPIISANMDTVTEAPMAIEMALSGGMGIIHRFLPPEVQARQVRQVKERMRTIEDNPPVLRENATIADAQELLSVRERGYVIVHNEYYFSGRFSGIATIKDFNAASSDTPLSQVMTPNIEGRIITGPIGTTLEEAVNIMRTSRIEKLPIIKDDGTLAGVYTLKDAQFFSKYPHAALDGRGRLLVGAAIGVKNGDINRALGLVEAEVDVLVIDIAHGHHIYIREMLDSLRQEGIKTPVVAGNIATYEGARFLLDSGADAVKVGIGPGFVCETRDVAGAGVPQVTAILEAKRALGDQIPLIADGGIRNSGDAAIALAAGADSVMIGSLLAGTDKSPGEPTIVNGVMVKITRGMASASAFNARQLLEDSSNNPQDYVPEGRQVSVPYKGKTSKVLRDLTGGVRSGMSYGGARTITEMNQVQLQEFPSSGPEQKRPLGG